MTHVIHTTIGQGRRVAIPAELCREHGLSPGSPVVLESTDAGIVLRPLEGVIREVQSYFAQVIPAGVRLSEQLIRDREEESAAGLHD